MTILCLSLLIFPYFFITRNTYRPFEIIPKLFWKYVEIFVQKNPVSTCRGSHGVLHKVTSEAGRNWQMRNLENEQTLRQWASFGVSLRLSVSISLYCMCVSVLCVIDSSNWLVPTQSLSLPLSVSLSLCTCMWPGPGVYSHFKAQFTLNWSKIEHREGEISSSTSAAWSI